MSRIKLTIEYDGSNFAGYQVQPGKRTIQGEIEKALESVFGERVETFASGRTDAGVHAYNAVLHFDMPKSIKNKHLDDSLNAYLPYDVKVKHFEEVDASFDARFSPKKKTYIYKFYLSRVELPLYNLRAYRVNEQIDITKMREALKYLIGEKDFKAFVARKSGKTNFVRTIYSAEIIQSAEKEYIFKITGNGFLYNMVRIIMGTLISVGYNKISPKDLEKIIASKDRTRAGKTVPPYGLYLLNVEY